MESQNTIRIDNTGGIVFHDAEKGDLHIDGNDENRIIACLKLLEPAEIDGLVQVADMQADQLSALFKLLLNNAAREKNVVKGSITNVNSVRIGDEIHFHYAEAKLAKELTLKIPRTHADDIVGREEDLNELHRLLNDQKKAVVVNGLGGIGKTTLAQVFLSKFYDEYQHIIWVSQSSENLTGDFINANGLIANLRIKTANLEPAQLFEEIIRKLKGVAGGPNLIVIDNAGQSIQQYLDILPSQPQWHLLVTSREEIAGLFKKSLGFLSKDEAVKLFNKYYTHQKLTDRDILELIETVDYHTLTIEILAKSAEESRYDLRTLKQAIEKDSMGYINQKKNGRIIESEKIGTYLSSLFNLSKLGETEIWLMKQFTCLPAEYHTFELLQELLVDEKVEGLPGDEAGPVLALFSETIASLTKKGWLLNKKETDSFKMHRVIAEVVKKQETITIDDVDSLIESISERLKINEHKDNPADKFKWIPYGKAVLTGFSGDGDWEIGQMQNSLGYALIEFGDYYGAKDLLLRSTGTFEEIFGKDSYQMATVYADLGLVYKKLGDYKEAKIILQKAVDLERTAPDHFKRSMHYSNLAMVLSHLEDYKGAKDLMEKAIALDERTFGKDHPKTALRYNNLATVLHKMGDLKGAKELYEKALESDKKHFEPGHPRIALDNSNLATVLEDLKDYTNAKKLMEMAIESNKKNYGEDHPNVVKEYAGLVSVLKSQGDYRGAKEQQEKMIASYERRLGKTHVDLGPHYAELALILKNLEDYRGAAEMLYKVTVLYEDGYGKDNPATANSYYTMAVFYNNLGYYAEAVEWAGDALSIMKNVLPPGHEILALINELYQSAKSKI